MSQVAISSLLDTLIDRLGAEEGVELEFKAATGGLPSSLWPTVSAFANTRGGWIVLGIEERNGKLDASGLSDPAHLVKTFFDQVRNAQKISYPICSADDVSIESYQLESNQSIVIIRVPAAPLKARPVYISGNPYTGTYIRRQSGDYRCTKAEVDRMMREASDVAADSAILPSFGWDDLDHESLARYRRRFQTLNPASPWNAYDDHRFLRAIGGFRRDRDTGQEGLTVAGLLLLGTSDALREWRTRHLIDFRLVSGDPDSDTRWDDRVVWEGNLLGAFEAIYPPLVTGQPVPFRLEGGTRIDESPVHVALREALVNLLVHADYAEPQVSLIKRSPEGYLFRNPGSSRVSEVDLFTGDRSDPRNPELVKMFRLIGLAEEAGTGMPKIIKAWRERGFRLPDIDVGTERYEFTLLLRHAHLLSDDDRAWLQSLGGSWSEAEQLALVLARHDGDVDNLKLRSLTGQHPADVTKVLGGLRDRGLLYMSGTGRSTRYQLTSTALRQLSLPIPVLQEMHPRGEPSSDTWEPSSDTLLPPKSDTSTESSDTLRSELLELSRVARERPRLDSATRDQVLLRLCALVPLSLRDLSEFLGRSEPLVRKAVRKLIATQRLAYLYPAQPNHPRQKYIAVGAASTDAGHVASVLESD